MKRWLTWLTWLTKCPKSTLPCITEVGSLVYLFKNTIMENNNYLLALMHDTAHDLDRLKIEIDRIHKWLKENAGNDAVSKSPLWVSNEYLRSVHKNIKHKLDEFYIKTHGSI